MSIKKAWFIYVPFVAIFLWLVYAYAPFFASEKALTTKLSSLLHHRLIKQQQQIDSLAKQVYADKKDLSNLYDDLEAEDQVYLYENRKLVFWPKSPKLDGIVHARYPAFQVLVGKFERPMLVASSRKTIGDKQITLVVAEEVSRSAAFFQPVWLALTSVNGLKLGIPIFDEDKLNLELIETQRLFFTLIYLWLFCFLFCLSIVRALTQGGLHFLFATVSGYKLLNGIIYTSLSKQISLFDPKVFAFNIFLNSMFDLVLMVLLGLVLLAIFLQRKKSGFLSWLNRHSGHKGFVFSAALTALFYFLIELQIQSLRSIYDFSHIQSFEGYFNANGLLLAYLAFLLFFRFAVLGFAARNLYFSSWKRKFAFMGIFLVLVVVLGLLFDLGAAYLLLSLPSAGILLLSEFGRAFSRFQYRAYMFFLVYLLVSVAGLFASFQSVPQGTQTYFSKLESKIEFGKEISEFYVKELGQKLSLEGNPDSLFLVRAQEYVEQVNKNQDNLFRIHFLPGAEFSQNLAPTEKSFLGSEQVFSTFSLDVRNNQKRLLGKLFAEFGLPSLLNLIIKDVEPGSEFAISKRGNIVFSTGSSEFNDLVSQLGSQKVFFKRSVKQDENYEMVSYHVGNSFYFHYASRKPDPEDVFVIGLVYVTMVFGIFILIVLIIKVLFWFRWSSLPFLFRIQSFLNLSFFLPVLSIFLVFQIVFYPSLRKLVYVFVVNYFTNQNIGAGNKQFVGFVASYQQNGRLSNTNYAGNVFPDLLPFNEYYRLSVMNDSKPNLDNASNCIFVKQCDPLCGIKAYSIFFLLPTIDSFYSNYYKIILITISSVFLVFVFFSFSVSQSIVLPFNRFSGMLKSISLNNLSFINERVSDEFDRIFKVFNKLIFKIQEDKRKLETTERELAWKDVARQVAHEVKNPLTPLRLNLQMLEQRLKNSEVENKDALVKYFPGLFQQIDALDSIATEFATFSRLPNPQLESLDLVEFLTNLVRFFNQTNAAEIGFQSNAQTKWLQTDANMLGRALTNLMLNAIQSAENASVVLNLEVSGKQCLVTVSDNGPGIPIELQPKVFTLFFTTKSGGSGIGLAMMKRDIEALGGKVWFESNKEVGTTFFIELPFSE